LNEASLGLAPLVVLETGNIIRRTNIERRREVILGRKECRNGSEIANQGLYN
jgi:ABC-type branched-subunit amino acid transport system ATPase component